jgi:transposase
MCVLRELRLRIAWAVDPASGADLLIRRLPELCRIKEQILAWHRSNEMSVRLDEAPGVGPVLATAVVATVADPKFFRSGCNFSAWIDIVPKYR